MEVLVQFDRAYAGPPSEAVWLVRTLENGLWFEQHVGGIDANSALFDENTTPLAVIWHVFDHHPDWTEIVVSGAALTPEIQAAVEPDGVIVSADDDSFRLRRR